MRYALKTYPASKLLTPCGQHVTIAKLPLQSKKGVIIYIWFNSKTAECHSVLEMLHVCEFVPHFLP